MSVTPEQIQHIGRLARLRFAPDKLEQFTAQFNRIVGYVEKLNLADTQGVQPMTDLYDQVVEPRTDQPGPLVSQADALKNAPRKTEGFFSVPKVIGDAAG